MLGQRHEQQIEHAHRKADERVLHRVEQRRVKDFPQEEHEKRQHDEQHGVFHGALGLLVDVDGLDEHQSERRRQRLLRQLLPIHLRHRPPRRKGAREVLHAPVRRESVRADLSRVR